MRNKNIDDLKLLTAIKSKDYVFLEKFLLEKINITTPSKIFSSEKPISFFDYIFNIEDLEAIELVVNYINLYSGTEKPIFDQNKIYKYLLLGGKNLKAASNFTIILYSKAKERGNSTELLDEIISLLNDNDPSTTLSSPQLVQSQQIYGLHRLSNNNLDKEL